MQMKALIPYSIYRHKTTHIYRKIGIVRKHHKMIFALPMRVIRSPQGFVTGFAESQTPFDYIPIEEFRRNYVFVKRFRWRR